MSNAELIETLTNNSKLENCDSSFGCSRQNLSNRSNSLSESTGNSVAPGSISGSGPGINFNFTLEDKIPVYVRRRYQTQVRTKSFDILYVCLSKKADCLCINYLLLVYLILSYSLIFYCYRSFIFIFSVF